MLFSADFLYNAGQKDKALSNSRAVISVTRPRIRVESQVLSVQVESESNLHYLCLSPSHVRVHSVLPVPEPESRLHV